MREREQQIIHQIEIDTHLLVKWNEQIKLDRFRQRPCQGEKQHKKVSPKVNSRNFRDLQMQIQKCDTKRFEYIR